jgi:hypothetical protein
MNQTIRNVIKYILWIYPYKSELSASRVTKILYLVDWKCAIERNTQLTDAKWYFNHYGPYVHDFMEIAENDNDIIIKNEETIFGGKKRLICLSAKFTPTPPGEYEKFLVDFVIEATKSKNYDDFIKLVYSTYPVLTSSKYSKLDLLKCALSYKEVLADRDKAAKA